MIVVDASPLIHLARIGRLELIPRLYERAASPSSVIREVVDRGRELRRPDATVVAQAIGRWLDSVDLPPTLATQSRSLRRGVALGEAEADAIVLAEARGTPVLTDDALAVRTARVRGLEARWTTSLVLEAVARSLVSKKHGRLIIHELVRSGLHIAPSVLLDLLRALE